MKALRHDMPSNAQTLQCPSTQSWSKMQL